MQDGENILEQLIDDIFDPRSQLAMELTALFSDMHPQNYPTQNRVRWLITYIPRFQLIFKYDIMFKEAESIINGYFNFSDDLSAKLLLVDYLSSVLRENGESGRICTLERIHIVEEIKQNLVDPYSSNYMSIFHLTGYTQYFILIKQTKKLLALMKLAQTQLPRHWQFFSEAGYIIGMYYGPAMVNWDLPHHFSTPEWVLMLDPNNTSLDRLPIQAETLVINGPRIREISDTLEYRGNLFVVTEDFQYMNGTYLTSRTKQHIS